MAKKTTQSFIKEAKTMWGNQNDYSSVNYIVAKINIDIRCRKHDLVFSQTPDSHLQGRNGCPKCQKENRPKMRNSKERLKKMALGRINSKKWRRSMVGKRKYTSGYTQGKLTVVKRLSKTTALCRCECGLKKEVSISCLSQGTQSCGCLWIEAQHERRVYRVGFKQGQLEVIEELKNNNLLCKCECGKIKEVTRGSLGSGTESCGCLIGSLAWKGYKEISHDYFNKTSKQYSRYAHTGRIVPFKLTIEELWDLYIAQDRKCNLTGWDICFKTRKSSKVNRDQTASLDRIDSNGIYELGNVQWVHKDIQSVKWDLSNREVIDWCRKVRNNEKSYNR
jgi:hypothetical protein